MRKCGPLPCLICILSPIIVTKQGSKWIEYGYRVWGGMQNVVYMQKSFFFFFFFFFPTTSSFHAVDPMTGPWFICIKKHDGGQKQTLAHHFLNEDVSKKWEATYYTDF